MGIFFKYLLYFILGIIILRFIRRSFNLKPSYQNSSKKGFSNETPSTKNLDKPKYNIDAESVDYEIIDESKERNEK